MAIASISAYWSIIGLSSCLLLQALSWSRGREYTPFTLFYEGSVLIKIAVMLGCVLSQWENTPLSWPFLPCLPIGQLLVFAHVYCCNKSS